MADIEAAVRKIARLRAREAELVEALTPFAAIADQIEECEKLGVDWNPTPIAPESTDASYPAAMSRNISKAEMKRLAVVARKALANAAKEPV